MGLRSYRTGYGKIYVYFGGVAMDTVADVEMTGENQDDWLGYSVAGAGNVNQDDFDDVIVSAPLYPNGQASGRAYILLGGSVMDNLPDVILDGDNNDDQFGWSVDGGADINNDLIEDVIVGARFNDCAADAGGSATIYWGGTPMDNQPDLVLGSTEEI